MKLEDEFVLTPNEVFSILNDYSVVGTVLLLDNDFIDIMINLN